MIKMKPTLAKLRKEFETASNDNKESFMLCGHELLTGYAKYLIEYLEMKKTPENLPLEFVPKNQSR